MGLSMNLLSETAAAIECVLMFSTSSSSSLRLAILGMGQMLRILRKILLLLVMMMLLLRMVDSITTTAAATNRGILRWWKQLTTFISLMEREERVNSKATTIPTAAVNFFLNAAAHTTIIRNSTSCTANSIARDIDVVSA